MNLGNRSQCYYQSCAFVTLEIKAIKSKRTDTANRRNDLGYFLEPGGVSGYVDTNSIPPAPPLLYEPCQDNN